MDMKNKSQSRFLLLAFTLIIITTILLIGASIEVYQRAQGTGNWLGLFSAKWGAVFFWFVLTSAFILLVVTLAAWQWKKTSHMLHRLAEWRDRFRWLSWVLVLLTLILTLWLLHYTSAGNIFTGSFLRLLILFGLTISIAFLVTPRRDTLINTSGLALSLLLISSAFTFSRAFSNVVDYPFSLTWSEGNRIWDYSILFGRDRYIYPADQPIFAYIDFGRQSLWGLPFLIPGASIQLVRLWNVIVITIPYAALGWVSFQRTRKNPWLWFLCGLWTFVFLSQGPIYTPLVLSAILVAAAWWLPIWLALPLIALAGFYAAETRFTWMFAPAMWAMMTYLGEKPNQGQRLSLRFLAPAFAAILAGLLGAALLPQWIDTSNANTAIVSSGISTAAEPGASASITSLEGLTQLISRQPLIWSRLLPNPTFGTGIILGLILATIPLTVFLIYLVRSKKWRMDIFQKLAILAPLLAFLAVGLVISVKIGGGGDLHNMDMYLIGLVFAAALAWKAGAHRVFSSLELEPGWVQALIILMMAIIAYQPVKKAASLNLPPSNVVKEALDHIREEVDRASETGEILFMDQRQLLTFGFIEGVPLVPDYEKKYLMDQAMSNDAGYFEGFYEDISNQRFALIISEPLKIIYQGSDHHFGDENDTWVDWVSKPVLCYYEPIATIKRVKVQLLVPRSETADCP